MEILLQEGVGRAALPFSGPELQASAHLYGSEKLQGLPRRLEGDKLALGRDPYTRKIGKYRNQRRETVSM